MLFRDNIVCTGENQYDETFNKAWKQSSHYNR
jgi:hypothetical protein